MLTNLPVYIILGLLLAILLSTIMLTQKKTASSNFIMSTIKIVFIVIFSILLSSLSTLFMKHLYQLITYPTYEATIISLDKRKKTDEDGDTYYMYQPTYNLYDGKKEITIISNMATTDIEIGDKVNIAYKDGSFIERQEGTIIMIVAELIGLSILFFILGILVFKEQRKYLGIYLFKSILFLFLLLFTYGILHKLWLHYLGEVFISATMLFALIVMLAVVGIGFMFIFSKPFNSIESKKEENKTREVKKKRKRKKSTKHNKKRVIDELDLNLGLAIGLLIFLVIFSIISLTMYIDEGLNFFSILFGLISIGMSMASFYFYLAYKYFKNISLSLFTRIQNGNPLKGEIVLNRNIKKSTKFIILLQNTHKVPYINKEGERDERTEVIWEIEQKALVVRKNNNFSIPFSFSFKNYKNGDLRLKVKANLKKITFTREFPLD